MIPPCVVLFSVAFVLTQALARSSLASSPSQFVIIPSSKTDGVQSRHVLHSAPVMMSPSYGPTAVHARYDFHPPQIIGGLAPQASTAQKHYDISSPHVVWNTNFGTPQGGMFLFFPLVSNTARQAGSPTVGESFNSDMLRMAASSAIASVFNKNTQRPTDLYATEKPAISNVPRATIYSANGNTMIKNTPAMAGSFMAGKSLNGFVPKVQQFSYKGPNLNLNNPRVLAPSATKSALNGIVPTVKGFPTRANRLPNNMPMVADPSATGTTLRGIRPEMTGRRMVGLYMIGKSPNPKLPGVLTSPAKGSVVISNAPVVAGSSAMREPLVRVAPIAPAAIGFSQTGNIVNRSMSPMMVNSTSGNTLNENLPRTAVPPPVIHFLTNNLPVLVRPSSAKKASTKVETKVDGPSLIANNPDRNTLKMVAPPTMKNTPTTSKLTVTGSPANGIIMTGKETGSSIVGDTINGKIPQKMRSSATGEKFEKGSGLVRYWYTRPVQNNNHGTDVERKKSSGSFPTEVTLKVQGQSGAITRERENQDIEDAGRGTIMGYTQGNAAPSRTVESRVDPR